MKILVDARELHKNRAGIGRYIYNLFYEIGKLRTKHQFRAVVLHTGVANLPPSLAEEPYVIKWGALNKAIKPIWEHYHIYNYYRDGKFDLFYAAGHYGPILRKGVRLVATIHDLTPFLFPHTFPQHIIDYLKFTMKKIIKKSLYISVPSQNTRDDILKMFSLSEDKVVVIYPSLVLSEPKQIAEDNPIKIDKYVLAVATNEPRKNFHRLIRAYAKLPQELKREYPLVIVGRAGWKVTGIDRLLEELQLKGNVFITGFVEENILAHLFKNASLFCYPSLYEGFGLPPLEAMFYGAPVLTSSVSSLPEIVGDSAYLVDPYSIDDISQGMNKLLVDESLRMKYKDAGNLQVKKYLDNGFAQKTLKLFESCL